VRLLLTSSKLDSLRQARVKSSYLVISSKMMSVTFGLALWRGTRRIVCWWKPMLLAIWSPTILWLTYQIRTII